VGNSSDLMIDLDWPLMSSKKGEFHQQMIYQIITKNHEVPAQKHLPHKNQTQNWRDLGSFPRFPIHSPLHILKFCMCKEPLLQSSMVTSNHVLIKRAASMIFLGSISQEISIWLVTSPSAKGRHIHGHLTIARCRIRGRVAVHVAPSPATENQRCSRWMMGVGLEVAVVWVR
jgi:hypothetical protein